MRFTVPAAGRLGRRSLFSGAVCLLILAGSAGCSRPPRDSAGFGGPRPDSGPSRVVVITDEFYPPYVMRSESGELEGIVVDLWAAWERVTGIPVDIRAYSWSEAQDRFARGEGDVIETIFDTPERRKRLSFSPPYARIPVPVFTHASITGIAGPGDLRGFRIAVKSGDAAVAELIRRGVSDLSLYGSYKEIVEAAARHEVRVFCVDGPPAYHYLYRLGIDREFRQAFILNEGAFSRAVRRGDESLLETVQRGFDALPPAETAAVNRRWMGSELPRVPDWRILGGLGAAAALLVAFLAGATVSLRRKVEEATRDLKEKIFLLEGSEARITRALREKEVLIQEIHHRVKNNLQIISSLLRLQAEDLASPEARDLLAGTQSRIAAMADLHDRLYNSRDLERIDAGEYLRSIGETLASSFRFDGFRFDTQPLTVSIETALPLGLLVNECAINAVKYAYPAGRPGHVEIRLRRDGPDGVCSVRDSGRGLPPDVDPRTAGTLGFTIVRSLASQLRGRVRFDSSGGFTAEVRFPLPEGEGEAAGAPGEIPGGSSSGGFS